MAITSNTPWNKTYFEVSGTYTGTDEKHFKVIIDTDNGVKKYKWKSGDKYGVWGSYSSLYTLTVGTAIALTDGLSIKFTRTSANSYNDGDIWTFQAYSELQISNPESGIKYDFAEVIERQDKSDLVLFSSNTGSVSVIEEFDTESPTVIKSDSDLEPFKSFHAEKKNKELYVSTDSRKQPKWVGYTSNDGWELGIDDKFIIEDTLDKFDSSTQPNTDTFDKFIVLRGSDTADTKDAKLLIGIHTEENPKSYVGIYNPVDDKLFNFKSNEQPIAIRKWYKKTTGNNNYCAGFVLMTHSSVENRIAELQFWSVPNGNGSSANLDYKLFVNAPNSNVESLFDFLIVPSSNSFSTCEYTLVFATNVAGLKNYNQNVAHTYEWLWKINSSDWELNASANTGLSNEGVIDSFINITPKIDFSDHNDENWNYNDLPHGWCYLTKNHYKQYVEEYYEVNTPDIGEFSLRKGIPAGAIGTQYQRIVDFPTLHSLELGGFYLNGTNPFIMWTVRFAKPRVDTYYFNFDDPQNPSVQEQAILDKIYTTAEQNVHQTLYDFDPGTVPLSQELVGPLLPNGENDEKNRTYRGVEWGTYAIPVNTTSGVNKQKLFIHFQDWGTSTPRESLWESRVLNNQTLPQWLLQDEITTTNKTSDSPIFSDIVPAQSPLFEKKGRFHIFGDKANASRIGMIYYKAGTSELLYFRFSSENSYHTSYAQRDTPGVFPNRLASAYSKFNLDNTSSGYNVHVIDGSDVRAQSISSVLDSNKSDDAYRYRLGEQFKSYDFTGWNDWYPTPDDSTYLNAIVYGNALIQKSIKIKSDDATITNLIPITPTTGFVVINENNTQPTSHEATWKGPSNLKKVFYKISFIYDGYQESVLLSATGSHSNSNDIDHQVDMDIKIKDSVSINKRISAIAVYRATGTTSATQTDPEGLYRFIEEIPLYKFNFNNDYWTYTIRDTGDSEGTYESLNNLSELSYDLNLKYKVSAQQNGFLFAGNASHNEIEDASNFIFRSQAGKYSIFDWTRDFVILPFVPTCLKGFMGKIYAFSNSQMAIINPESLFIEDIIEGIGCVNNHTVKVTDAGMIWCDYKNIYISSPKILPVGESIKTVDDFGWSILSKENKDTVRIGYDAIRKSFLIFFTKGSNNKCWAYSIISNRWDLWDSPSKVNDCIDLKTGECMLLLEDNKIVKYLAHSTKKRSWSWESKKLTFGKDLQEKRIRNVKISSNSREKSSISYKVDNNYSSWNNGIDISTKFPGAENSAIKLSSSDGVKHYWVKYKIDGDNSGNNQDTKVFSLSTIYKAKRYK